MLFTLFCYISISNFSNQKHKGKGMNININESKYNVEKEKVESDCFQYTITPKKRNCKLCNKSFENNNNGLICWSDDKGFRRSGYFCREHLILVKKALKELR